MSVRSRLLLRVQNESCLVRAHAGLRVQEYQLWFQTPAWGVLPKLLYFSLFLPLSLLRQRSATEASNNDLHAPTAYRL